MSAVRTAVTACAVAGAGLVLAAVMAGPALMAAPAQAATAASAARTAAPAGTPGAGQAAAASHERKASHGRKEGHGRKGAGSGSGQACTSTYEFPAGYDEKCFRIDGQGVHIEKATAWVVNKGAETIGRAHFEIIGPAGQNGHIANCDDFYNLRGYGARSPDCSWEPHADEPAGRYCAILWIWDGSTWYRDGINTCIDVHA